MSQKHHIYRKFAKKYISERIAMDMGDVVPRFERLGHMISN